MSLENQSGYHEVHIYERAKEDFRKTTLIQSHIVHGDRTQIARHFWDLLPDDQVPYVYERIATTALEKGFKEKVAKIAWVDGTNTKPEVKDIIFLGKNWVIQRIAA